MGGHAEEGWGHVVGGRGGEGMGGEEGQEGKEGMERGRRGEEEGEGGEGRGHGRYYLSMYICSLTCVYSPTYVRMSVCMYVHTGVGPGPSV